MRFGRSTCPRGLMSAPTTSIGLSVTIFSSSWMPRLIWARKASRQPGSPPHRKTRGGNMELKFSHVDIVVKDLDHAVQYYKKLFGCVASKRQIWNRGGFHVE